jgi:tetrahydromethanopterin S-methyltransferase subunit E
MLANLSVSPGTITALADIFGSLVGAFGSSTGTWEATLTFGEHHV